MKNKIIIGIDPGLDGAIGILMIDNRNGITEASVVPTPSIKTKKMGGKNHRQYIIESMVNELEGLKHANDNIICYIENVHSMPGQGVASMFNMGKGFGLWIGILAALHIKTEFISPQSWKKEMIGKTKQEKKISCETALKMFPYLKDKLYTKKGRALDGNGDAILIAEYGRRLSESRPNN